MTDSVLNREIPLEEGTHPIPHNGEQYVPLPHGDKDGFVTTSTVQTILVASQALYELWSEVTLFPRWQEHVISVTPISPGLTHWVTGDPDDADGKRVEFDSQLTEDVPGHKIAWKSISDNVDQMGSVTFAASPSGRGTLVTLTQTVKVPLGGLGNAIAAVAKRSPRQTVIEDLRHFKQLAETGEIPSVKGQPHGPRGISGGIKEWLYGDSNPTPPGTSDLA